MIRKIVNIFILVVTIFMANITSQKRDVENKLIEFTNIIYDNGIDYFEMDELYLVFDYKQIENDENKVFDCYQTKIIKESESSFILEIKLNSGVIETSKKERFYIRRNHD